MAALAHVADHGPVARAYGRATANGELVYDPAQSALVSRLDDLIEEITNRALSSKSSSLGWLFARSRTSRPATRGLYIWGGVGRGKSLLMDLFFDAVPGRHKRRVHFNDFMQDVHERIHDHRKAFKAGKTRAEDPIPPVAADLAARAPLICLDEFAVTDIADAMILGRLFEALFERRAVVVATSNVAPDDLYADGLNRQLFLPFIDLLKANMEIFELDSPTDYRLAKLKDATTYHSPLNGASRQAMDRIWLELTGRPHGEPSSIELKGRKLAVPQAWRDVARFSFADLCEKPRGAADFIAIARAYRTVLLDDVPRIAAHMRNEAKRFILLIDTLYDHRTKLVMSAQCEPDALYTDGSGTEAFEFARTVSRLIEMRSREYLAGEA